MAQPSYSHSGEEIMIVKGLYSDEEYEVNIYGIIVGNKMKFDGHHFCVADLSHSDSSLTTEFNDGGYVDVFVLIQEEVACYKLDKSTVAVAVYTNSDGVVTDRFCNSEDLNALLEILDGENQDE